MVAENLHSGLHVGQRVDGCEVIKLLGRGWFSSAFLLFDQRTGASFVRKETQQNPQPINWKFVQGEVKIHKKLQHPNIIEYYNSRQGNHCIYLDMELASCRLIDKIKLGLPVAICRQYFKDLITGLEYLHNLGIAHRDIKPDNLLIGYDSRLKIADFGLAASFKNEIGEIMYNNQCGAERYMAPEVLKMKKYRLPPADIWSCGIVLVVMLTRLSPWKNAHIDCPNFLEWKEHARCRLFDRLDAKAYHLISIMLQEDAKNRATIKEIKKHLWLNTLSSPVIVSLI